MTDKRDKLGRRIPQFDRSAAGKKAAKTAKEKYGPDYHSRVGIVGASLGTRGYFGKLKAEGKTEELKKLAHEGAEKSNKIQAEKRFAQQESALRGPSPQARAAKKRASRRIGPRRISRR